MLEALVQHGMLLLVLTFTVTTAIILDCDPCIDRKVKRLAAIMSTDKNDAIHSAMQQAAADMNVMLEFYRSIEDVEKEEDVDAWILNFGDDDDGLSSKEARVLLARNEVIFGFGWGYDSLVAPLASGWIASNDAGGAKIASHEFYEEYMAKTLLPSNTTTGSVSLLKAAYVFDVTGHSGSEEAQFRSEAFESEMLTLQSEYNITSAVEIIPLVITDASGCLSVFQDCPHDAILLDNPHLVARAIEAKTRFNCTNTSLGVFLDDYQTDMNPLLYQAITKQQLDFVLDPQVHMQASMTVTLAALFVTTGKKPSFPIDTHTYWTGPALINKRNVPSDTTAICQKNSFPVCHAEGSIHADAEVDWLGLDLCPCTDRSAIRLGAVLHGTPGGFWDPVFASAKQAAQDMRIELELTPFTSKEDFDLLVEQMSARIRNLCETGIDGLIVSIPDPRVADAVQRCLDLFVPVISINSGGEESKQLGLMHHVGQNEYAGGFQAAEKLIATGMTRGFCVDHEFGNSALAERCQGFKDAIAIAAKEQRVEFGEHIAVPRDNDEQFRIAVEEAVGVEGDWEGVGFLQLSASSFRSLLPLLEEHTGAMAGAFDLKEYIYDAIGDGILKFTIDQQPFLQGAAPVYLLTHFISTRQYISNHLIESGPSFIQELPSEEQKVCEANQFAVCPDRPEEDMSYISSALLIAGNVLFGIILAFSLGASFWTFYFRDLWVVKVSQPMFLYLIVLGAVISSLSIPFMGVETSYRLDRDESGEFVEAENPRISLVDASCMAVPWLYGMGFVLIFSALFAKILRVRLMFLAGTRLNRKPVTLRDVLPVMAFVLVVEIVILTWWQIKAPLRWQRDVIDELDGYATESVGSCTPGNTGWGFFFALIGFHVLCLCFALVLCYQTRQLNNDFAESSYVSLAVAFLFQVLVLTTPILALVQDNTDVYYFVRIATVFLQNITVLSLIFVPKMLRMKEDGGSTCPDKSQTRSRGKSASPAIVAPSGAHQSYTVAVDAAISEQVRQASAPVQMVKDSWAMASLSEVEHIPKTYEPAFGGIPERGSDCIFNSEMQSVQEGSENVTTSSVSDMSGNGLESATNDTVREQ